jgi:hypothetical protein
VAISDRIKHAWNAFANVETTATLDKGAYYSQRPDRLKMNFGNERSLISSIYNRLSIDMAAVDIRHVRLDSENRYLEDMDSGLNNCLTVEANLDQGARAFRQDIAMTLFDKGVIALVPVDTTISPLTSGGFDIRTMRVGHVVAWFPKQVRVSVYNENTGRRQEITLDKKFVAIVENPLYTVMNEPNSTLQRLIRKLNMLDSVDEQSSSGKLDMIIQLPYVIKSESRREQANQRRSDIEQQLRGSKYGIAYTDGTEKITQLNRPLENNLLKQIEYLTSLLYSQLGLTPEVMNGTADEATMKNYYNRTIEPIVEAVVEAMRRSFLTKTARSQKQGVMAFRDPFKLVPIADIAEIADKFTRNEIASSNDIRQAIGWKPAKDPKADQLVNSNMPQGTGPGGPPAIENVVEGEVVPDDELDEDAVMQSALDELEGPIDEMLRELGV